MKTQKPITLAKKAVLTLAEVKAAVDAFDRGDASVFCAIDAIQIAVDTYRVETMVKRRRSGQHRRAA